MAMDRVLQSMLIHGRIASVGTRLGCWRGAIVIQCSVQSTHSDVGIALAAINADHSEKNLVLGRFHRHEPAYSIHRVFWEMESNYHCQ